MPSRTATKSMPLIGQRRRHARVVNRGTQVDVVVQGEAQAQEQTALEHAGGDGGIADGPIGAAGLDGLEILIGEGLAGAVPCSALRSKVGRTVTPVPPRSPRTLSPS